MKKVIVCAMLALSFSAYSVEAYDNVVDVHNAWLEAQEEAEQEARLDRIERALDKLEEEEEQE